MTPENVHHLRSVGWTAASSRNYCSSFTEVLWPHNCWRYKDQLFHILASEVIEAVHRATGNAQRLPGADLNGGSVNRPSQDAFNPVKGLLIGFVLWAGAISF
jgi:hypothetical protein